MGTSALRAAAFDLNGMVVGAARGPRPRTPNGQFDSDELWASACAVLRALTARVGSAAIEAVCVCGATGSVLVDTAGRSVAPSLDWSAAVQPGEVPVAVLDTLRARARRPNLGVGALVHARRLDAASRTRVVAALSPKDDMVRRLTGTVVTDPTSAAYSQVYDVLAGRWNPELVAAAGLDPGALPPVRSAAVVAGGVSPVAAADTGLRPGTPVAVGGPDGTVGAIALLGPDAGATADVADIAGTTDVLVRSGQYNTPPEAVLNPAPTGTGFWAVGPTGRTGGLLDDVAHAAGFADAAGALAWLGPQLQDNPDLLPPKPFTGPSRFPWWLPNQVAEPIAGPPAVTLAAVAAAVTFVMAVALDVFAEPSAPVRLAGGGARSPYLVRLRADVTGRPTRVAASTDVTLHGAAMLAAAAVGRTLPPVRLEPPIEPDPYRTARYAATRTRWARSVVSRSTHREEHNT